MQIYRYFDVGTAKPPPEDRKTVPHHLIDIINPDEEYSAGRFKEEAEKIIGHLHAEKKIPIVAGGTGLYINSLLNMTSLVAPSDSEIREKLKKRTREEGNEAMYEELSKKDPVAAEKIKPTDTFRIERALEVYYITGKPISSFHASDNDKTDKYNVLYIVLNQDRSLLYEKINNRVDNMIKGGLVDEVKSIVEKGYPDNLKPFQSIGYKETVQYLKKEISLEEAAEKIKKGTRNYAKRQLTWFRKVPFAKWIEINPENPELTDKAIYEAVKAEE